MCYHSVVLPPADGARVFRSRRRVRLSDADAAGRLRLDAAARYIQDVATDDVADARLDDGDNVWIVRRTEIEVRAPFQGDQFVELATWSGGFGPRWAARRTRIDGDRAGRLEAETTWVLVNGRTMRPALVPETYRHVYGDGAGRRVSVKLQLAPDAPAGASRAPWPVRASDVDILGHVNNAVYWQAVEEALGAETGGFAGRAVLEHRRPVDRGDQVELCAELTGRELRVWLLTDGAAAAVAELVSDPGASLGIARPVV